MRKEQELFLSEVISPLKETAITYTPPAGCTLTIKAFNAEAPYTLNSVVKLIWDYGTENEEILWSIRGSGGMKHEIILSGMKTDGTKKLAISCDNAEVEELLMGAYTLFDMEDYTDE